MFGQPRFFVSSVELADEICDEQRFNKAVSGALKEVRNGVGDGLFTAFHGEHNWEVAHRTLVPAFGPLGIKDMFDEMYDIATQLVAKWARQGSDRINVTDDYTRLTLDSIALCAMDKRFNSFYSETLHPFVDAMVGFLQESGRRPRRTKLESLIYPSYNREYQQNINLMRQVAEEVIATRRRNPTDKKDLLNAMLLGKDPKTGERLTDDNVMNNMITFLIAGHETTSGLLSFASYYLLKNPETLHKAQHEVDSVVGRGPVKFEHMSKLPYAEAVLRETLRLQPTAPAFTREPNKDVPGPVALGGKYYIPAGAPIIAILPQIHRDPLVYGVDADEFKPERMYGENFTKLPPNAWKPFGNGARGCIGRPFAWQEAILTLALILQNFNLRMDDPSYQLQIKQTLTMKPDHFFMRACLRDGINPINLEKKMYAGLEEEQKVKQKTQVSSSEPRKPMTILYGSNAGTCEGLAQVLANNAPSHGFSATVKPLDEAVDQVPNDQPVVIITASYEGNPPDNAGSFVEWLKTLDPDKLKEVKYAVFGCGHHDWASTFHRIPKLVDSELENKSATRIVDLGVSDVAQGTVSDDFDDWQDKYLWPALSDKKATDGVQLEGLDLELSIAARASHLRHNVQEAVVISNESLTAPGGPEKRHMALKLPSSLTYEAGDYLAILPMNNLRTVSRVLRRFGLPFDAVMTLKEGSHTIIPTGQEMVVGSVLASYVELNPVASRKNMTAIASFADQAAKEKITNGEGLPESPSVLDILEAYPRIELPFGVFLAMLGPMRIRQYSISSSPLHDPTVATITYAVADADDAHLGVATNYLKGLEAGTTTHVTVKKSHPSFHLPLEDKTPIIMLCAGTGLAPFRGFVQERIAKMDAGKTGFGEALLFIGCRSPRTDKFFAEELQKWESFGAVKVYYAFSKATGESEGCKHVQDRLWREREEAESLFKNGARAYICGSAAVGNGIAETVAKIRMESAEKQGKTTSLEEGLEWWEKLRGERYAVDVFD